MTSRDKLWYGSKANTTLTDSSFTDVLLGWSTRMQMDVSWQMAWDLVKR